MTPGDVWAEWVSGSPVVIVRIVGEKGVTKLPVQSPKVAQIVTICD